MPYSQHMHPPRTDSRTKRLSMPASLQLSSSPRTTVSPASDCACSLRCKHCVNAIPCTNRPDQMVVSPSAPSWKCKYPAMRHHSGKQLCSQANSPYRTTAPLTQAFAGQVWRIKPSKHHDLHPCPAAAFSPHYCNA